MICENYRQLREAQTQDLIGKTVHVVVDRPAGCQHGNMVYPINYGYIPGIIARDGTEQEAYILGIAEPLAEFDGQVIAVIRSKNGMKDKFVVASAGAMYHQGQIAEAVYFREQYFNSKIDSLLRKSCGVIPFRRNNGVREYLILLQTNHLWSFPKGHMEPNETEEQTAMRELYEETGLQAKLDTDKRVVSVYDMQPVARKKQVVLFPGEVEGDVLLQETEVLKHKWVEASALKEYLHQDTYEACKSLLE